MKKLFKILTITIAAFLICFCFSGCQMIDDAREAQFIRISEDKIKSGDIEYILLPPCEYLRPVSAYENVYITDADVPVLLSEFFGETYQKSEDQVFVFGYSGDVITAYCRSDKYDEMSEKIKQGFNSTGYCYGYYNYEKQKMEYCKLTEHQAAAVDTVLSKVNPVVLPDMASLDYVDVVDLEEFSNDVQFRRSAVDIGIKNDQYYLINYQNDSTMIYQVPDNLAGVFKDIFELSQATADFKFD
ncbi:MAG: hypothetical protein Q4B04_05410 [bacterium]|nr:hypothetical protein [bacterium]